MVRFFEILSLCHTVQYDATATTKDKYQASSPDEFSFIKFCLKLNIVYEGEEKEPSSGMITRTVKFKNKRVRFHVLDVLEFDSTRKRMSIIVKSVDTGQIMLFCKGAESAMLKNCTTGIGLYHC